MIATTPEYREAITGVTRETQIQVNVDISDPDLVYTGASCSDDSTVSQPSQLYDKTMELARYATLEHNRWALDGAYLIFDDDYSANGAEIGAVSESMSDSDGELSTPVTIEIDFDNVSILQACTVWFPQSNDDGFPVDFTVTIFSGATELYSASVTDNTNREYVTLTGFEVYNPDSIQVEISKWSLPNRRVRVSEITPGLYMRWTGAKIADATITQNADPSNVSLPYGTAALIIDNSDKLFEPRNRSGIFKSLQERQAVEVKIGVMVDGSFDAISIGKFYQYAGGWRTSDNGLTIRWNLVDIIGLITEREYVPPVSLPTTVEGWISSILSMLGANFTDLYTIDASFSSTTLTANRADVTGMKCGDLILHICIACGAWARADATTGKLAVEPLWSQGNYLDLNNMEAYPTIQANEDVAQIIFTLADGNDTQYAVSGNDITASKSVSISNPFISTSGAALTAAQKIVSFYGGDVYKVTARGDPSCEVGDVVTLELDESNAVSCRITSQTFNFSRQVLSGCDMQMAQPNGELTYTTRVVITQNGTWTVPAGVASIRIILVGGGNGGTKGTSGTWTRAGQEGADGYGGHVYWDTLLVSPGNTFAVSIGAGGAKNGGQGGATTFGSYSSASGLIYTPSYTDITEGAAFGRTGVEAPLANTGDGGKRGAAGAQGEKHQVQYKDEDGFVHTKTVIDQRPGPGGNGAAGGSGCVVIYY